MQHAWERSAYTILVTKPDGKKPLGRPRYSWENIHMDLTETEWKGVYWTHVAQDRDQWQDHMNTVINFWVP
jgi:hypothetical protein